MFRPLRSYKRKWETCDCGVVAVLRRCIRRPPQGRTQQPHTTVRQETARKRGNVLLYYSGDDSYQGLSASAIQSGYISYVHAVYSVCCLPLPLCKRDKLNAKDIFYVPLRQRLSKKISLKNCLPFPFPCGHIEFPAAAFQVHDKLAKEKALFSFAFFFSHPCGLPRGTWSDESSSARTGASCGTSQKSIPISHPIVIYSVYFLF